MSNYKTEYPEWISFYPQFNSSFFIEKAGCFDERPEVNTSLTQLIVLVALPFLCTLSLWFLTLIPFIFFGWGKLYIHLPIKTGIQDCDSAAWGFNYHGNKIWIYIGGAGNFEGGRKWITMTMPWDLTWVRTSTLLNDNTWFNESKENRKKWDGDEYGTYNWLQLNKWKEIHDYTYVLNNGTVQNRKATISVEEMEWRWYWFLRFSLTQKIKRTIKIDFYDEVGERTGSWKGGAVGCGYDLLPNETPLECLRRMERERKF